MFRPAVSIDQLSLPKMLWYQSGFFFQSNSPKLCGVVTGKPFNVFFILFLVSYNDEFMCYLSNTHFDDYPIKSTLSARQCTL